MEHIRIAALLTALSLSAAAFASCGSEALPAAAETAGGDAAETAESAAAEEETTSARKADVPEKDYGGYEFRIIGADADKYSYLGDEIWRESENGEALNDSVYKRNLMTEEALGVKVVKVNSGSVPGDLKKSVMAADNAYDAAVGVVAEYSPAITSGYLLELGGMTYIDTSKPWWMGDVVSGFSIAGRRFLLFGDIIWQDKEATWALCFNKDLAKENGLSDPYGLVLDGRWTMDTLSDQCRDISSDINGDSVMDSNDRWGLLGSKTAGFGLITSCGAITAKNEESGMTFALDSARSLSVLDRIYDFIHTGNMMLRAEDIKGVSDIWSEIINIFREGRALYRISIMKDIAGLRDMEDDFGILPMPKFDESQESYRTTYQGWTAKAAAVPATAEDPERTGIVLEYMAYVSSGTMLKAYYDTTLQRKVSRDEESAKMLDIIFGSVITDAALALDLGGIRAGLVNMINADSNSNASSVEAVRTKMQEQMDKVYGQVSGLG